MTRYAEDAVAKLPGGKKKSFARALGKEARRHGSNAAVDYHGGDTEKRGMRPC